MANIQILGVVALCLTVITANKKEECPPKEDIPLCECSFGRLEYINGYKTQCNDVMNANELKSIMNTLQEYKTHYFGLDNAYLMYLPNGLFENVPIIELKITNSKILGWESDDDTLLFKGIENSLLNILMESVTGLPTWRWSVFGVLKKLQQLSIKNGDIKRVTEDFANVSPDTLFTIQLNNCQLNDIHDNAFSKHKDIVHIWLSNNQLTEVKRSMFPRPAAKLNYLNLADNKIKTLPDDLFEDMPSIVDVVLDGNSIQHISYETFKPLMEPKTKYKSWRIGLRVNELICCQDMKWMVEKRERNKIFMGRCAKPNILEEKKLSDLTLNDLDHGVC